MKTKQVFLITLIFLGVALTSISSYADSGSALSNIFTLDTRDESPEPSFALSNIFTLDTRDESPEPSFALSNIFTFDTRDQIPGDVSGNRQVTAYDAALVFQSMAQLIDLDDDAKNRADVNNDTVIDAEDAKLILRKVVGLIEQFSE